jgi:hypothetical protein
MFRNVDWVFFAVILLDEGQNDLAIESLPLPNNEHIAKPVSFLLNLLHVLVLSHFIKEIDLKLLLIFEKVSGFLDEVSKSGVGEFGGGLFGG